MKEVRSYYSDDGHLMSQETIVTCNTCGRRLSVEEQLKPYTEYKLGQNLISILSPVPLGVSDVPMNYTTVMGWSCDKCIEKFKAHKKE